MRFFFFLKKKNSLEAVVVDTQQTARQCIEHMKDERIGVLTFIPLDTIRTKNAPERLRNLDRYAYLAIDCVKSHFFFSFFFFFESINNK